MYDLLRRQTVFETRLGRLVFGTNVLVYLKVNGFVSLGTLEEVRF